MLQREDYKCVFVNKGMKIYSKMVPFSRWWDNYARSFNERSRACLKRVIETGKSCQFQFYNWWSRSLPRFSIGLKFHALFLTNQRKSVGVYFLALYFNYIRLTRIVIGLFICLCLSWLSKLLVIQPTCDSQLKTTFIWSTTTIFKNTPRLSLHVL